MTGPVTDPPPGGPGRELFGEYEEQLATVGADAAEALAGYFEHLRRAANAAVMAAPPINDAQRADLSRLLSPERL